ncbi:MAG: ribbon-helix-helix domain-containing protein [Candidatus Thermoplasmatota archaeon]
MLILFSMTKNKRKNQIKRKTVSIPVDLIEEVDCLVEKMEGYSSRAQFIIEAVRLRVQEFKYNKKSNVNISDEEISYILSKLKNSDF